MKTPKQVERAILAWFKNQYGLGGDPDDYFHIEHDDLTLRVHPCEGMIVIAVTMTKGTHFHFETRVYFEEDAESLRVETSLNYEVAQQFKYADPDLLRKLCEPIELPVALPSPIGARSVEELNDADERLARRMERATGYLRDDK